MDVFVDPTPLSIYAGMLPETLANHEVPIFAWSEQGSTQQTNRSTRSILIQQPLHQIQVSSKEGSPTKSETLQTSEVEALKRIIKQQQEVCETLFPFKVNDPRLAQYLVQISSLIRNLFLPLVCVSSNRIEVQGASEELTKKVQLLMAEVRNN